MRRISLFFINHFYKPLLIKWLSSERTYSYKGLRLLIHPDVFHPGFFFSTGILLKYLEGTVLSGKTLLELGAGSGLLSMTASRAGAIVTATDINSTATEYLQKNMVSNKLSFKIITSDLFSDIPTKAFDMIVINPPYYFNTPSNAREYAWFCGKEGEYFENLFKNISNYLHINTVIIMILCEGSKRAEIQSIAGKYGFTFECIKETRNIVERNYVYQIHASFLNAVS